MLTYHNKIKRCKKFKELLIQINDLVYNEKIFIENLDSTMSMGQRNKIIKDFCNNIKAILCSARVLNEGVNIQIVDSICFVDPRNSTIDIIQCIGRALRLYPNKKIANIIVPIFINDFNDNFDNNIFGNIIRILKALGTTDNSIVEYFKLKKYGKTVKRNIWVHEYYNDNISMSKEIDLDKWNTNIETKIWNKIDSFDYMYEKVKEWISENGKIPSKNSKNIEEKQLGLWCLHKRVSNNRNMLDKNKIEKLNELDYWFWNKEELFDRKYKEVKKWIEKNNRIPSQHSKDPIEEKLSKWCHQKRINKKNGKLSKGKINKLNKLPYWYWSLKTV